MAVPAGVDSQAALQRGYTEIAASSSLVRYFETVFVPGPLQTRAYAGRVLAEMAALHGHDPGGVDAAVAERMARGDLLSDPGRRWEFLLAGPVLRWVLPGPEAMREQLARLEDVSRLGHVRLGVVPMGARLATSPQNAFRLYEVPGGLLAAEETFAGETWFRGGEAAGYAGVMDRLWEDAVEGDAARELIARAVGGLSPR